MPIFQFKAYTTTGKEVNGCLDVMSPKEAFLVLKKEGLYPKSITLQSSNTKLFSFGSIKKPVSVIELSTCTRNLSTLIASGTPLYEALSVLSIEEDNEVLFNALSLVKESISEGSSLSVALEAHPTIFTEIYRRMVEAGEVSGTLDMVLLRLADYLESRARMAIQVKNALLYPAFMIIVGTGVLSFLFIYVIPKITSIFENTQRSLPLITVVLLFILEIFRSYWFVGIGVGAVAVWCVSKYLKTAKGIELKDRIYFNLPLLGKLFKKFYIASFSRTLGNLIYSGVPILTALEMTRNVLNNTFFNIALNKSVKDLSEGSSLSASLKGSEVMPNILVQMIAIGERSGELDKFLLKAADSYEKEFDTMVSRTLSLIEPALVLLMGAIVGFIVLAILLPIFELNHVIK